MDMKKELEEISNIKLVALREVAQTQVEVMTSVMEEHNNLYSEGILEGWKQALKSINRMIDYKYGGE